MAIDKAVDSTLLDAACAYEAAKIRAKTGGSAQIAYDLANGKGFGDAIDAIPTGGGITWDDIATHNFSGNIILDTATAIKESAFRESAITGISAPNVVTPGSSMFYKCSSLTTVNLPKISGSSNNTGSWFEGCTSLVNLYLPENGIMWNYFCSGCSALKTFVMPKLGNSRQNNFNGCSALEKVDIGNANKAGIGLAGGFWNASPLLNILVLRYNTVCSLGNINTFTGAFASGGSGGTLYVPNDLISSYQSASNWSTILGYANNQIKSIESTHTDPNAPIDLTLYYADGTLIPT